MTNEVSGSADSLKYDAVRRKIARSTQCFVRTPGSPDQRIARSTRRSVDTWADESWAASLVGRPDESSTEIGPA